MTETGHLFAADEEWGATASTSLTHPLVCYTCYMAQCSRWWP